MIHTTILTQINVELWKQKNYIHLYAYISKARLEMSTTMDMHGPS